MTPKTEQLKDLHDALGKMLAAARLEGWRAGRDAATEPLTSISASCAKRKLIPPIVGIRDAGTRCRHPRPARTGGGQP